MHPLSAFALARKANLALWRGLEAIMRRILLNADERRQPSPFMIPAIEAPDLRMGALGHGCLEQGRAISPADELTPLQDLTASPLAEACVVGEGAAARETIRRLVALGALTHATAATVEDYAAVLEADASPRRVEDLATLMPRLDILISTGSSRFLDARLISRLPAGALIVDFAPAPGSVDFEIAKRFGHDVIWSRNLDPQLSERPDPWEAIRARVEAIAAKSL